MGAARSAVGLSGRVAGLSLPGGVRCRSRTGVVRHRPRGAREGPRLPRLRSTLGGDDAGTEGATVLSLSIVPSQAQKADPLADDGGRRLSGVVSGRGIAG